MKTLVFDVKGDYGHFRKYYATTSPVTFSVVTPTAVFGILGAILGLNKEDNEYIGKLKAAQTRIAIQIMSSVKKVRMGVNLINTKSNIWVPKQRREGARSPIRFEYVKDPHYRIYVTMKDDHLFEKLINLVRAHKTHYTVSLGLSELLADIRFIDVIQFVECSHEGYVAISSLLPVDSILDEGVNLAMSVCFLKERLPFDMDEGRVVHRYEEVLFDAYGGLIEAKVNNCFKCEEQNINIIFL